MPGWALAKIIEKPASPRALVHAGSLWSKDVRKQRVPGQGLDRGRG